MSYEELKHIIRYIQGHYDCPSCHQKFTSHSFHILGSSTTEGLMLAECLSCGHETYLGLALLTHIIALFPNLGLPEKQPITKTSIKNHAHYEPISKNDILDMHNLLKSIKGDFTNYLK